MFAVNDSVVYYTNMHTCIVAFACVYLCKAWLVQVVDKSDLSSAARRIWLAVHPDKNSAPAAQEVSKALSILLDSLKVKGVL